MFGVPTADCGLTIWSLCTSSSPSRPPSPQDQVLLTLPAEHLMMETLLQNFSTLPPLLLRWHRSVQCRGQAKPGIANHGLTCQSHHKEHFVVWDFLSKGGGPFSTLPPNSIHKVYLCHSQTVFGLSIFPRTACWAAIKTMSFLIIYNKLYVYKESTTFVIKNLYGRRFRNTCPTLGARNCEHWTFRYLYV